MTPTTVEGAGLPTEDDLRDALQLFSDGAEPAQLEPKKNRPRRTVVLIAVAATVAAAIGHLLGGEGAQHAATRAH